MVPLLLLPLLWGGFLQEDPGFELRVQELVTVQEGLCVHVPCSFSYPWSSWLSREKPYMYWFRSGDNRYPVATNDRTKMVKIEAQGRFHLIGKPWNNNCSLRITEARKSDQGVYEFQMERDYVKYSYRDKKLKVQVAALTQKPDIYFPEPLKSGCPTNLTCSLLGSCEEGRPLTFSWVGDALDSLDPQTLHSSVLTLTPRLQDHGSNLTCQVHLPGGQDTVERTIRLNVSYAPQKLNISIFFSDVAVPKILQNTSLVLILEGQALHLLCAADSSPPAELSWFRGSTPWNATPIYGSANLDLPQVGAAEEGDLTCQAQNPLGSQHISLHLSVVYPPRLLSPSCSWEGEGLHCSCSSRAHPAPTLRWRLGEGLLEGNHSNASWTITSSSAGPWANSSLSLSGPLGSGLRLSCEARNAHGEQSATVLLLPGKSVFLAGALPAALGGACAVALLSLSLCLLFFCIVKARRKQASGSREGLGNEDPVMGTVAWGFRQKPWPDSPPAQATPVRDAPPSGDEQELHYASFSFHEMKSREPADEEATSTSEYSEIKTSE
uniref:sialic acid-binding Ig-like lectin 5 isoform X1 n=1 Tax=Halichoerus grypus TaxID=9711 RepID=UPI0016598E62|nr:sialic acid-binding Ig-like lectin 5 isoform X1 [Halichoerus grypus]